MLSGECGSPQKWVFVFQDWIFLNVRIDRQFFNWSSFVASLQVKPRNGTDFDKGNYYALNFNDFFSGVVTLFCLMVVNNWFIIANGLVQVTQTYLTIVFFVSFFIIANLVCLNMLIALILDGSSTMHAELAVVGGNLRNSSAESEIVAPFQQEDRPTNWCSKSFQAKHISFGSFASGSTIE